MTVPPQLSGTGRPDIAIIGEAPCPDDVRFGKPFMGRAGRLLDKCLGVAGIIRPFCYVDNVVRECPPSNKFQLLDAETVARGQMRIREDLRQQCPKVVVACGYAAMHTLCPDYPGDIAKMRGLPIAHPDGYTVIPVMHPQFLMRGELSQVPLLIHDLKKARRFSLGEINRPERNNTIIYGLHCMQDAEIVHSLGPDVVFDIETTKRQQLLCIGFADSATHSVVLWLDKATMDDEAYANNLALAKILMGGAKRKIGQNIYRFDLPLLLREGFELNNIVADTMVLWHDCFPQFRKSLANLASYFTDEPYWKGILAGGKGEEGDEKMVWDGTMSVPLAEMNGRDCAITFQCWEGLKTLATNLGVDKITQHDTKCAELARVMTENGLPVSKPRIKEESERCKTEIAEAQGRLTAAASAAGWIAPKVKVSKKPITEKRRKANEAKLSFNVKSTKQVRAFITDVLKLSLPRNKLGKIASDAMALLEMARTKQQPLLRDIVLLSKKRTRAAFFAVKTHLGRFHPGINVSATKSGRWGGEKSLLGGKSLQNFPGEARHIFVADPGMLAVQLDKKQSEAYIVASKAFVETGDDSYRDLLARVDKVHLFLGRELCRRGVFQIKPEDFSSKNEIEYLVSKRGVHGFSYKLGPLNFSRKLAKDTDGLIVLPVAMAKLIRAVWFHTVPGILKWQNATLGWLRTSPELVNPFGRKIWLYTSKSNEAETGENLPLAWYPQSTCSDDLTHGAVRLQESKLPFRFFNNTHDGLWLMVDKQSWCPELCQKLHETMEQPFTVRSYDLERSVELTIGIEIKIGEDFGKGLEVVP